MNVIRLMRATLLDRYIIREIVPPTSLGLLVFTFILLINEIPRLLGVLVAHQADAWTIFRVFLNLLPSILAVTIPMAFLLGVLLAFGRMSSDSEIVALRASGVSPLRLIVPVLLLSTAAALVTFYINTVALPAANQVHRELVFKLVAERARTAVKPRTFTDKLLPGHDAVRLGHPGRDGRVEERPHPRPPRPAEEPAHPLAHRAPGGRRGQADPSRVELGRGRPAHLRRPEAQGLRPGEVQVPRLRPALRRVLPQAAPSARATAR